MKKLTNVLIFGILILQTVQAQSIKTDPDLKVLDAYIASAMEQWRIPGLAIGIVYRDQLIFAEGYGVRDINHNEPVTSKTLFAIASNTKAFTATALAMLVDRGLIDWDDRVQDYLPWFQLYDPWVSYEMRIRDLLCHRSGLKTFSGDLIWYGTTYDPAEVIRRARYLKPEYSFRTRYGYSNILFLAAGEIIPAVTGQSWDDFVKEEILQPLEMDNTTTSVDELSEKTDVAQPHHVPLNGPAQTIPYVSWDNIAAAGGLNSNVQDMSHWIRFQLNMGIWEDDSIIDAGELLKLRELHTPIPMNAAEKILKPSRHFSGYGLGWALSDYHGKKVIGHGGGADGMISRVTLVPEKELGFVILTNSINYLPTALSDYILDFFLDEVSTDWSFMMHRNYMLSQNQKIVEWQAFKEKIDSTAGPSLPLEAYTGTYGGRVYGNVSVILQDGSLLVDFIPTPMFTGVLKHLQYDSFEIRLRDKPAFPPGTARFIVDEKGVPIQLIIDIPNPDFDFTELDLYRIGSPE